MRDVIGFLFWSCECEYALGRRGREKKSAAWTLNG